MMLVYFLVFGISLFCIGISGIIASRHFIIMMLSIEIILAASMLLATAFYYYVAPGSIIILLLTLWSIAAAEIMAIVVMYRYMVKEEVSLDVSKLSKLRSR